jgi:hypothetical protein
VGCEERDRGSGATEHHRHGPSCNSLIYDNIPPDDQPEFVRCWKLATKQAKAAQTEWENADKLRRDGLPQVPGIGMSRKRDEGEITDPGILAIGVALDKAEELREIAVGARAAAVKNPKLKSEFEAALLEFNKASVELRAAWEAKWRRRK